MEVLVQWVLMLLAILGLVQLGGDDLPLVAPTEKKDLTAFRCCLCPAD